MFLVMTQIFHTLNGRELSPDFWECHTIPSSSGAYSLWCKILETPILTNPSLLSQRSRSDAELLCDDHNGMGITVKTDITEKSDMTHKTEAWEQQKLRQTEYHGYPSL